MRKLLPYICLFALAGCLSACTGSVEKNETENLLSRAESVMEQYPDSALAILDTVSRQMLHGREQTARYSLLYSQALEKNDILLETDSVIAPAVRYYRHHGTADERLLTQYYSGCIHWNAGDLDEALECFLHGERYADKASDHQAVGRLYSAMKSIYYEIYEFARSYDYALKAADSYARSKDTVLQSKSLITAVDVADIMEMDSAADSIMRYVRDSLWKGMDDSQRGRYYLSGIVRLQDTRIGDAMDCLHAYLRTVTDIHDIEWGLVSRVYLLAGKTDSARVALDNYEVAFPDYQESMQYHLLQYLISKAEGRYGHTVIALEKYIDLRDKEDEVIYRQDTRFVEERLENEIQRLRQRYSILLLSSLSVIVVLLLLHVLHLYRKKLEHSRAEIIDRDNKMSEMTRLYSVLKDEKEKLESLSSHTADEKSIQSINNVLSLLTFISLEKERSFSDRSTAGSLKQFLNDRNALISVMLASYSLTHHEFVQNLRMKGLTNQEIGYCCLYASGLSGKDISVIFGSNSHYNIASRVRSKVGLKERESNLSLYIRSLLSPENETKVTGNSN